MAKKTDVINAGDLTHKIIIQKREVVQDNYGQEIETFSNFLEVWANVSRYVSTIDYKFERNAKKTIRNRYYVELRYITVLKEDMILIFKGKTLKILNMENVFESNKKLLLICEEVV